ncbi:MAG: hypothetical protein QM496_07105 [Verrucomicrobiota bacterium]
MASVRLERFGYRWRRSLMRAGSIGIRNWALVCLLFWQGLGADLMAQAYQDPDFEIEVFDQDALSLQGSDRTAVVEALAALASNFPKNGLVDMDLREKALALALRLDPLNPSARAARAALLVGGEPVKTGFFKELPSINKALWTPAMAMREGREPEDKRLYPLLMELALVIDPKAAEDLASVYAEIVDELGGEMPGWKGFVQSEQAVNSSSARIAGMLKRGRIEEKKLLKKEEAREKEMAKAKARALAQQSQMAAAAKGAAVAADRVKGVKLPSTEVSVIFWQGRGRGEAESYMGKVSLNIRTAEEADADLFQNEKGHLPEAMGMRFRYLPDPEEVPAWMSMLFRVVQPRVAADWPRGKVGELTHVFSGDAGPMGRDPRNLGGMGAGALLALESAIKGVPMDPAMVVYTRVMTDQSLIEPPAGDFLTAVKAAKQGKFRALVVAEESATAMKDWVALGSLDLLIRPQIVAAANFDELIGVVRSDRAVQLDESIELFAEIEELTAKMTLEEAAKNEVVQQRLQAILEQFPQHLSAKMLLAYGKGGGQIKASLTGSVKAILGVLEPLKKRYSSSMDGGGSVEGELEGLGDQAEVQLRALRVKVNDEAKELLNMSEDVVESLVAFLRLKNKTTSTGMQKREAVEEALVYFNEEFRRLEDKSR